MKVVSLNISQAKEVIHQGKTIRTGIFKTPIQQPVLVGQAQLNGDVQADLTFHGGIYKAVYGFSANHYDYWRDALSQPDLHYGAFGENLTVTGLDESQLCIGDQLAIGETILTVSQPRVPCFKLAIALNNKKAPSLFSKHGATGIYFSVAQQGHIAPNDEVTVVDKCINSVTVHALFNAYYDRHFSDANKVLEAALKVNALAPEWQEKIDKRLSRDS